MPALSWITFDAPVLLFCGLAMVAAAVGAGFVRGVSLTIVSRLVIGVGLVALAIAAGEPHVGGEGRRPVAVMVDGSPSTRGASYRNTETLRARVKELLGNRRFIIMSFGDDTSDRTTWTAPAPDAAAVLLFSDGRFEPPATSAPVYAVIDPLLERPGDASITSLERRGEQLVVTTSNDGAARELTITGAMPATQPVARAGVHRIIAPAAPSAAASTAQLTGGDAWPENDALSLTNIPPATGEWWWIGDGAPDATWRALSPADLSVYPAAYLNPSVIALSNVAATSLSAAQQQRLRQYVRDLGGGLLILGGDRAFAAGAYDGSILAALSPLASSPPAPVHHWVFLLDASGSMAGELNGRTRLAVAVAAARDAIGQLPPNDLLSVAGFAAELRWWMRGKAVKDLVLDEPPAPRGPTNLDAALLALSASTDKAVATQVVILTDGQIELPAADEIAASLKSAQARLHVFAIGSGPGLPALRSLAESTGGIFVEETDGARWAAALVTMLRQTSPRHWNQTTVDVDFDALPRASAAGWNRTWLKANATEIARTVNGEPTPMGARINVGNGQVAAVSFRPPDGHVRTIAESIAGAPKDPRLTVTWRASRRLTVDIDAADDTAPLNGLSPTLVLTTPAGSSETFTVPQTGPGRYGLTLAAPRLSTIATLHESGRLVDRFAVAGRYAPEFDGTGNDRAALASLAQRTGGRVIEPTDRTPLTLPAPARRGTPLAHYFAAAGALLVAVGLIGWRIGR